MKEWWYKMKISFYYGTVASSKTAQLLMIAHNYEEKGIKTFLVKPALDTRSGNELNSRAGLSRKADLLVPKEDVRECLQTILLKLALGQVVLIDEAQFLPWRFVKELSYRVHSPYKSNGDILCFGLLTDMDGHMFTGTKELLEEADKIIEVKTLCHYCERKATKNLHFGKSKNDSNIDIGVDYYPVCNEHYYYFKDKKHESTELLWQIIKDGEVKGYIPRWSEKLITDEGACFRGVVRSLKNGQERIEFGNRPTDWITN